MNNSQKAHFVPNWDTEGDGNEIHLPGAENRSPYTYASLSKDVIDAVRNTYQTTRLVESRFRANSFHNFAKLPVELRTKIWTLSLPDPRLVPIFYNDSTQFAHSNCPIPSQLHVNYEARKIARKRYQLAFGIGTNPPAIWFDFIRDEMYFGVGNLTARAMRDFLAEISREQLPDHQQLRKITIDDNENFQDILFSENELERLSGEHSLLTTIVKSSGNCDTFLAAVDDNLGELQAWSVCPQGQAFQWTPNLVPETVPWEIDLLNYWESFEMLMVDYRKLALGLEALGTVRWVSIDRLSNTLPWKERQNFLQDKTYVLAWDCLIPKGPGFYDFLLDLEEQYPTLFIELGAAFTRQVAAIPRKDWGADKFVSRRQDLDFHLPDLLQDQLLEQAPCVCRISHENNRGVPKDLHTLPLLDYLRVWMVDEYLRIVELSLSSEESIDHGTSPEERSSLLSDDRLKSIGNRLLETINENMAKVVQTGVKTLAKQEPNIGTTEPDTSDDPDDDSMSHAPIGTFWLNLESQPS